MTFEKFFRLISYTAVFCGFLSLWVSGTFGIDGTCLFVGVMAAAWFLEGSRWQITERIGTALIVLSLPAFYLIYQFQLIPLYGSETVIAGILSRMILSLTAIKLLQKKSDRDWIFLYLMAFFEVLLAAGLSISLLYLLSFVLFVMIMVCTIIAFEVKRTAERVAKSAGPPVQIASRAGLGGRVELLLLRHRDELTWEALVGGKGLRVGRMVRVENGPEAEIMEILEGSERLIKFSEPIEPYFSNVGNVPLPPYIHEKLSDPDRYQTVYSRDVGSAAAPTAGLHFTPQLLDELKAKGVKIAYVTLHVGLDTFAPVTEDDPEEHKIHTEWCELPQDTADLINQTKQIGGRVVAVGTTSVRTLESPGQVTMDDGRQTVSTVHRLPSTVSPFLGPTNIFILPGFQFKIVDAMVTNFHLPNHVDYVGQRVCGAREDS